jgi:hypothetical protein
MLKDLIVEETRQAREEFAAQFDYDISRISRFLMENQAASGKSYLHMDATATFDEPADFKKAE